MRAYAKSLESCILPQMRMNPMVENALANTKRTLLREKAYYPSV